MQSLQKNTFAEETLTGKLHFLCSVSKETKNKNSGVHVFCLTRWSVRGKTLHARLSNHNELMELMEWFLTIVKKTDTKKKLIGMKTMMEIFNVAFGCATGNWKTTKPSETETVVKRWEH